MWMWNKDEKYNKLIKAAQKWLEFNFPDDSTVLPETTDFAYKYSQKFTKKILDTLKIDGGYTEKFMESWIQVGLFSGFISGWIAAHRRGRNTTVTLQDDGSTPEFDLPEDLFSDAFLLESYGKTFSRTLSSKLFSFLEEKPSPLIMGLNRRELQFLKFSLESSLFSGFMAGADQAFKCSPLEGNNELSDFFLDDSIVQ